MGFGPEQGMRYDIAMKQNLRENGNPFRDYVKDLAIEERALIFRIFIMEEYYHNIAVIIKLSHQLIFKV